MKKLIYANYNGYCRLVHVPTILKETNYQIHIKISENP